MSFPQLTAALAAYDATQPERDRLWETLAFGEGDLATAEAVEARALVAIREAFYADTQAVNQRSDCMRLTVREARRLVAAPPPRPRPLV